MASSVVIEAHRKRFTVKAGPMAPLSTLVADVLGQLKLPGALLAPEECRLLLKGKPLDLSTPLRFANVGREKLELCTGREPVLGVQAAALPPPPSSQAAAPQPPPPTAQQQQQQEQPQAVDAGVNPALGQAAAVAAAAGSSSSTPAPTAATPAPEAAPAPAPAPTPPAADPAPAEDAHPSVALFGRRVHVFTREAEEQAESGAAAASGAGAELDDSFFDFTEMDLRRALASQATQRARQEGGHLMTAQMREREERRRAESFGSVPIRLYLPGGTHCLQTALPATEPLSSLLALVRAALLPAAAAGADLFTTPPRTVLKDLSISLYAAKLVPAAKVHVGLDASKAGGSGGEGSGRQAGAAALIKPEVLALVGEPPRRAEVMHGAGTGTASAPGRQQQQQQQAANAAGSGTQQASGRSVGAGGKPVPKWLKLGK